MAVGVYWKLPSLFSVSVPWLTPLTSTALRLLPSASLSLASTPGTDTLRLTSSLIVNVSLLATGASSTAFTVMATVAAPESAEPSLAL